VNPYGCYNRQPFQKEVVVQDGWANVPGTNFRIPVMKTVPFRMREDCSYANETELGRVDPRCEGCSWKKPAPPR
jgi:hypothetical protein